MWGQMNKEECYQTHITGKIKWNELSLKKKEEEEAKRNSWKWMCPCEDGLKQTKEILWEACQGSFLYLNVFKQFFTGP